MLYFIEGLDYLIQIHAPNPLLILAEIEQIGRIRNLLVQRILRLFCCTHMRKIYCYHTFLCNVHARAAKIPHKLTHLAYYYCLF